jgi:hypothetical protein
MRRPVLVLVPIFIAAALWLMVTDAVSGDDWPGWDEGWALIVFPLGIPLATALGLAVSTEGLLRRTAAITVAVWMWGAVVFVLWHLLG